MALMYATSVPRVLTGGLKPRTPYLEVTERCPDPNRKKQKQDVCANPRRDLVLRADRRYLNVHRLWVPKVGPGPYWNPRWFPQLAGDFGNVSSPCEGSCAFGRISLHSHIPGEIQASSMWRPISVDVACRGSLPMLWCKLRSAIFPYGGVVTTFSITANTGKMDAGISHHQLVEFIQEMMDSSSRILATPNGNFSARGLLVAFTDAAIAGVFESGARGSDGVTFPVTLLSSIVAAGVQGNFSRREIAELAELIGPLEHLAKARLKRYKQNDYGHYEGDVFFATPKGIIAYLPSQSQRAYPTGALADAPHDKKALALIVHSTELAVLQRVIANEMSDATADARRELDNASRSLPSRLRNAFTDHFLANEVTNTVHDILHYQDALPNNSKEIYDAAAGSVGTGTALHALIEEIAGLKSESATWTPLAKKMGAPALKVATRVAVAAGHALGI